MLKLVAARCARSTILRGRKRGSRWSLSSAEVESLHLFTLTDPLIDAVALHRIPGPAARENSHSSIERNSAAAPCDTGTWRRLRAESRTIQTQKQTLPESYGHENVKCPKALPRIPLSLCSEDARGARRTRRHAAFSWVLGDLSLSCQAQSGFLPYGTASDNRQAPCMHDCTMRIDAGVPGDEPHGRPQL